MDEAIAFIKENVYFTREDDTALTRVFTTGIGCSQNRNKFKDQMQCRLGSI